MYARQERTLEAHTLCWQWLSLVDHQFPFCATWYYLENKNNDQNRIRRLQPSVCSVVMETIQWTFPCGEGKFSSPGKRFYKFGCANLAWKMQGWCTADKWRGGGWEGREFKVKLLCYQEIKAAIWEQRRLWVCPFEAYLHILSEQFSRDNCHGSKQWQ